MWEGGAVFEKKSLRIRQRIICITLFFKWGVFLLQREACPVSPNTTVRWAHSNSSPSVSPSTVQCSCKFNVVCDASIDVWIRHSFNSVLKAINRLLRKSFMMCYPHEFEYNLEDVIHSTIKTFHTYSAQRRGLSWFMLVGFLLFLRHFVDK